MDQETLPRNLHAPHSPALRHSLRRARCYNSGMALTLEEVEHIAELARLRLTDEEKALFREQLSAILDYADMLNRLDTSDIPPTATVLPLRTVLRPDEVTPSTPRERLLANAPAQEAGMFQVPPVLD